MVSRTYGANSSLMGRMGEYLVKLGIWDMSGVWTECLNLTDGLIELFMVPLARLKFLIS